VSDHGAPDPSWVGWVEWALTGMGGALLAGLGGSRWVSSIVEKARKDNSDAIDKVRKDGELERDALWERLNKHLEEDNIIHLNAERRFATQDGLDRAIDRVEKRLAESEKRIIDAIGERGPIRGRT
jgi:hypothetical protein